MTEEKSPNSLKKGYRPPFPIRIFLDYLIESVKNKNNHGWKITMVVDNVRFLFYLLFFWTIIVGLILTTLFVDFDHSEIVMDVFGGPNLCTYVDFPPATYFTFFFLSFSTISGMIYSFLSISRLIIAFNEKKISARAKTLMIWGHVYFMLSLVVFTDVLAVQPDRAAPVTMRIHTIPYTNLKIALLFLQYYGVWFGTNVAWNDIKFSSYKRRLFYSLSWLHFYVSVVGTVFGCMITLNGVGDMGPSGLVGNGLWWHVHDPPRFARMIMVVFGNKSPLGDFVLLLLLPIIQSMIIKNKSFGNTSKVNTVTFYIYDSIST